MSCSLFPSFLIEIIEYALTETVVLDRMVGEGGGWVEVGRSVVGLMILA